MSFAEVLAKVGECSGVSLAAIADMDGIPVQSWGGHPGQSEELIAEYSTFLREITTANRELQLGELEQVMVTAERLVVLVTAITANYYLMTVVGRDGNPGKARFVSRAAASRLRQEFA
jgi:predicted regulator of Ras-like GTPase activity (Roadblock/LC7/MglB family)